METIFSLLIFYFALVRISVLFPIKCKNCWKEWNYPLALWNIWEPGKVSRAYWTGIDSGFSWSQWSVIIFSFIGFFMWRCCFLLRCFLQQMVVKRVPAQGNSHYGKFTSEYIAMHMGNYTGCQSAGRSFHEKSACLWRQKWMFTVLAWQPKR